MEEKIFEKRLEAYSSLYRVLSNFIKEIQFDSIDSKKIKTFFESLQNMDSSYGILYGVDVGLRMYDIRWVIHGLTIMSPKQSEEYSHSDEKTRKLRLEIQKVEIALKRELGVYDKDFDSYRDIADSVRDQ